MTPAANSVANPSVEIFLHGFGDSANSFRHHWQAVPGPRTTPSIWLDAPEHEPMSDRRRWFPFTSRESALAERVLRAARSAEAAALAALESLGVSGSAPVVLVGHSQGAMLCLEMALARRLDVVGVHCYAAFLPASLLVNRDQRPQLATVFSVYSSTNDKWIPQEDIDQTVRFLAKLPRAVVMDYRSDTLTHPFCDAWLDRANFSLQEAM